MDSYETLVTLLRLIADAPACAARLEQIKAAEQCAEAAEAKLAAEQASIAAERASLERQREEVEARRLRAVQAELSTKADRDQVYARVREVAEADDRVKKAVLARLGMIDDFTGPLKSGLPSWETISRMIGEPDPHYGEPATETVNERPEHVQIGSTLTRSVPSAAVRRRQRLAADSRIGEE